MEFMEYHVRLNCLPVTQPGVWRFKWLDDYLQKSITTKKYVISGEKIGEPGTHLHCLCSLNKVEVKKLRAHLKSLTCDDKHKRPYSLRMRRGNLLSYLLKDRDESQFLDMVQDNMDTEYYDKDSLFSSIGYSGAVLKKAYLDSYPKVKVPKDNWKSLRRDWIMKFQENNNCNASSLGVLEKLQNKFTDEFVSYHIQNNRNPPHQQTLAFWLLKLRIISYEQYRFRRYTNFF